MSDFVLDSSVALAWCFPDEATPEAYRVLERLDEQTAIVPSLWYLEIANILGLALRKNRITKARLKEFIKTLDALPITFDPETASRALTDTLALSQHYALTAYDAAYLELARRLSIPLASKDRALCQAARKLKVALIEV